MAVVSTTTYLYADTSLTQYFIQGAELVDRGAWSSATAYVVLDVVQIGVDQYVAIQANTNTPPTAIVDEYWSTLVVVEEGEPVVSSGSDWYARYLAGLALELAGSAYELAGSAYSIGTDAYNLANGAFEIAVAGTNMANAAYALAQIGTNTGTAALEAAASAQSTADAAFEIAVIGTNAAADAYALAQVGTDAVITEAGTRSERDQILQNQITVLAASMVPNLGGSGSPVGVVTPAAINQFYTDRTNVPLPTLWQATGLTNTDWQQLT